MFGQLVIGPPGSGKTTYCWKMRDLLVRRGAKVITVNLDPANDACPFRPDVDVRELIRLDDAMRSHGLGPNGGLVHCVERLERDADRLREAVLRAADGRTDAYLILDAPGQVELYTHDVSLAGVVRKLGARLCVVHLVDSHHCSDAAKFVSSLTVSLAAMLRLGLPHVNALSKIDLLRRHSERTRFRLDFYTEVLDLSRLLEEPDDDGDRGALPARSRKFVSALASLAEDYGLVSFLPLDSFDERSLEGVRAAADRANGRGFGGCETAVESMLSCAMGATPTDEI